MCQISLAQAQTPRKDETTGTTQTWKGQELGGGRPTEESQRGTQDNPAQNHSGLVDNKGKTVLYAHIPPQDQVNDFVFTVMSDDEHLCSLTLRQNYEHAHRKDRCKLHIQFDSMKWCLIVTSGRTWDYNGNYQLNVREFIFFKAVSDRTFNFTLEAEDPCVIKHQPGKVVEIDQSNPLKSSDNDKINITTAIDKVDQPPVRDNGINSLVTTKSLNSTLDASKTNETSIREDTTILAITNVTSIGEATTNVTPIREITTVMGDLIIKLTTNGTAATAQGEIIQTTVLAKVEVTTMIMSKEDNIETMATAISMAKSETMATKTLTSTPMSLEETLVEQTTIRKGNNTKSIGRHSTARTLKQYKPDPSECIRLRTTAQLFRQAKTNRWYKWVEFTVKQIEANNLFV